MRARLALVAIVVLVPLTLLAQHETAADLLDGERAYRNSVRQLPRPGRRRHRRHRSRPRPVPPADDRRRPGRASSAPASPTRRCRPAPMTVEQAQKIVAYLRSRAGAARAGVVTGDAARGQSRRSTARAAAPRATASPASASGIGPDLTDVGALRGAPSNSSARCSIRSADVAAEPTASTASC